MLESLILLLVVTVLYVMVTSSYRWISVAGLILSLIAVMFLALELGYRLQECLPAPVSLKGEMRV